MIEAGEDHLVLSERCIDHKVVLGRSFGDRYKQSQIWGRIFRLSLLLALMGFEIVAFVLCLLLIKTWRFHRLCICFCL